MKLKRFRKYLAFSKAGILDGFAYKFSALGWLLGDLVSIIIIYFLWEAIYKNSPTDLINGMSFLDMISYLIFARVTTTLVFSTTAFFNIGYDIYLGNIAVSLIRPINYRFRLLASSFGNFCSTLILMFLPLFLLALIALNQGLGISLPELPNFLVFAISIVLSFMIADSLNFLIGEIAVFTNALFGLFIIKNIVLSFFSGSLLPSSFFPDWLNTVLDFLPFKSMIESPVLILLGKVELSNVWMILGIQLIWVLVLSLLCQFSFNRIKKHVVSVGG